MGRLWRKKLFFFAGREKTLYMWIVFVKDPVMNESKLMT